VVIGEVGRRPAAGEMAVVVVLRRRLATAGVR
jgi:hypothetical protein